MPSWAYRPCDICGNSMERQIFTIHQIYKICLECSFRSPHWWRSQRASGHREATYYTQIPCPFCCPCGSELALFPGEDGCERCLGLNPCRDIR